MAMPRLPALLGLCACFPMAASPAIAQTVYRCGPNGSSYSQTPCPGGRAVDVDDARTPEQQQQAQSAADRDARLGASLERDRRMEEALAAQRSTGASTLSPSRDSSGKTLKRTLEVVPHYSNQKMRSNPASAPKFEAPAAMLPVSETTRKPSPRSSTPASTAAAKPAASSRATTKAQAKATPETD